MKKLLLVLISVLLLTGVTQAAEIGQAISADYTAQNQARSRATDESVILKVWATEGTLSYPGVGVSSASAIIVYTNYVTGAGVTINPNSSATDTVGEIVDYINDNLASDSSIKLKAGVGTDAYRDLTATQVLTANITAAGISKATAVEVKSAHSTILSAGVEAVAGVTPRLKSISTQIPAGTNGITLRVYDGNTLKWRQYIGSSAYNSATNISASPNSVRMPEAKGLAGTKGNLLCVTATADGAVDTDTIAKSTRQISIIYDNLRD